MVVQPSASLQVVPSLPMNQGGGEIALQQEAEDVGEVQTLCLQFHKCTTP